MKPLVIYGAGGFAREALELVRDVNRARPQWDVLGFLDDSPARRGTKLNDLPVLGGREWLDTAPERPHVVLGVGSPAVKRRLAEALRDRAAGFPTVVHPTVVASRYVELGTGVLVTAGNILTTQVKVGDFAMLNLACTVGHDCDLGAYVTVSPGANVSGNVRIGEGTDVGTGARIIQGISIGAWTVVGAGAVVSRDLPDNCTAVGVPARVIREREPGWHAAAPGAP